MARLAADAAALLDAVGWDTAAVVGVSSGGMVARELAVNVPHRVERLALPCTSAGARSSSSCGEEDAPPANSETMASRVPGADLHVYEGGHASFVQGRSAPPDLGALLAPRRS